LNTVAVATIAIADRQFIMQNYFRSLVDLQPEEICIVDTTIDDNESALFQEWLRAEAKQHDLPLKIERHHWTGNYSVARNYSLDICTTDWVFFMDSDEIPTNELARDLKEAVTNLPDEALVLRPYILNLVDDTHYFGELWQKGLRYGTGNHGRIVRRGHGRWERNIHEIYNYPGRGSIPWSSPRHPKKDWFGYYFLHLWFYKDAPLRRNDWSTHDFNVLPKENSNYTEVKGAIMKRRRWVSKPIPKDITWKKINWKIDPTEWKIR
jgi:glycosyltransferase involved in cell wall biosynthesis